MPEPLQLACEIYAEDKLTLEVMRDGSGLVQVRTCFLGIEQDVILGATSLIRLQAWLEMALAELPRITVPREPPADG